MVSKSYKDTIIIIAVLAVVAVGYLIFSKRQGPPEQQTSDFTTHPDVEGMDRAAMASMLRFPTDYDGLIQMGNESMDAGNFPVAAESYKRALAVKGDDPNVRTDYGACLHGMGLPNRALEEFRKVLADHPRHAIANFNMGIVFYNEQKPDSAKVYWEKYLEIDPQSNMAGTVRQYLEQIGG